MAQNQCSTRAQRGAGSTGDDRRGVAAAALVGEDEVNWSVWGSGEGGKQRSRDVKDDGQELEVSLGDAPLVKRRREERGGRGERR
jgi:hypothetical protein